VLAHHAQLLELVDADLGQSGGQFVIEAGLDDADTQIVSIEPAGLSFVSALHGGIP
jgi:hypothetical protein